MKDKEKQKIVCCETCNHKRVCYDLLTNTDYEFKGYGCLRYCRDLTEDSVVLSREEAERFRGQTINIAKVKAQASKETAEKILNDIDNHLKKYAHIHKYAENANKTKEEYADGTPVELNSVWEVLSLHKNGYDTYETMCELQDNIGYIQESRLLKEFEKDFKIYAKQFGVEIKE